MVVNNFFNENWQRWVPIEGLAEKYSFKYQLDIENKLKFILFDSREKTKQVSVNFNFLVNSYISTDETYRFRTIIHLDEKFGKNFYANWTFFKITNSQYLEWVKKITFNNDNLQHFCFLASDHSLDVIAKNEPIIKFIQEK